MTILNPGHSPKSTTTPTTPKSNDTKPAAATAAVVAAAAAAPTRPPATRRLATPAPGTPRPPSRDSDQPRDRGPGGHSGPARDGGRGGSARGGSRRGGSGRARGSDDRDPIVRPEPLPFELVADPEFEPDETQDPTEFATAVLTDLVRLMRIEAAVSARAPETPMDGLNYSVAVLDVTATDGGDDLHVLIGRNGDHLAALQYMVNLIVNRALKGRHAFTVDIDGYKRRREQDLHTMATAAVAEVRETQHLVELEPMTPAERRIIHPHTLRRSEHRDGKRRRRRCAPRSNHLP